MADIITLLPGIIGDIVGIINWCKEYYKNVREAAKCMNTMIELLGPWKFQLELLEDLITVDDHGAQALQMKLVKEGVLKQTRFCLQELKDLVRPESDIPTPRDRKYPRLKRAFHSLTWPITKQNKADELLRELGNHKASINLVLSTKTVCVWYPILSTGCLLTADRWDVRILTDEVKKVEAQMTEQEKRAVLTWLQPDKIDSHDIHLDKQGLLEDETCDWMIKSEIWKTWKEGGDTLENGYRRFLWIHGIPGSGKTILASFIIDTIALSCKCRGYSYYYCSYQRGQDETRSFLQWVIKDLCIQSNHCIPVILHNIYEQHKHNVHSVSTEGLLKCLLAITKQFGTRVYIIVDATDESSKPRNHFLKVLTTIGTDPSFQHVSLLMTSRDELDIRGALEALPPLRKGPSFLEEGIILTPQISPGRSSRPLNSAPNTPYRTPNSSLGCVRDWGSPSHPRIPPPYLQAQTSRSPSSVAHQLEPHNSPSVVLQSESRPSSPLVRKYSSSESEDVEPHTPTHPPQRRRPPLIPTRPSRGERLVPEISKPNQAYTELSMDNQFVLKAIRTYVGRKLQRIDQLKYLRPEFLQKIEMQLAREARGMFRWVACQIDMIIQLDLSDESSIEELLGNLPPTVFDTYERLIMKCLPYSDGRNENNRTFARTALALICSNSAMIPSADVLVEASLFNVPRGLAHQFDINRLEKILGCLIKVTRLTRKPATVFKRDDDGAIRFRVTPAHYTVKEYLFNKETAKGPVKDFALSNSTTQVLELQVVFNGLLQFGNNRPRGQRDPTSYEEYCLRMTDKALRLRRSLITKEKTIWEAVLPCLRPDAPHQSALRNQEIRNEFPRWAKLNAVFRVDKGAILPLRHETGILVNLLVLKWPELAGIYLRQLEPADRAAIWTDRFTTWDAEHGGGGRGGGRGNNQAAPPGAVGTTTILQLCVSLRRLEFLEELINAGADFAHESGILYAALRDPYAPAGDFSTPACQEDGATTGQLLKMVLQRGADPNPQGYLFTPLQAAVHHLEERWVQSLLLEHADANAAGDPDGVHPFGGGKDEDWYDQHPLRICREASPDWQEGDEFEMEDQIRHARLRVAGLLVQYGAVEPEEEEEGEEQTDDGEGGNASQSEDIAMGG